MSRRISQGPAVGRSRVLAATSAAALALAVSACGGALSPTVARLPDQVGEGSASAAASSPLLGTWRLVALQQSGGPVQTAPAGTLFSAEFRADGGVAAVVDCNRCGGGYTAGAATLSIGPMACTRAYCVASAPFDSRYETLLGSARGWCVRGTTLEIQSDGGVLMFAR